MSEANIDDLKNFSDLELVQIRHAMKRNNEDKQYVIAIDNELKLRQSNRNLEKLHEQEQRILR